MSDHKSKEAEARDYLNTRVNPVLERLVKNLLVHRPDDVYDYMIECLKKEKENPPSPSKGHKHKDSHSPKKIQRALSSEGDDDDEMVEELPPPGKKSDAVKTRPSISAEAYGAFNKKGSFVPKVIQKSEEQKERIKKRLDNSFMFSSLEPKDKEIVINSMDEKKVQVGEWVIKQGEAGDHLYVIDAGQLECYKQFSKDQDPKMLKTYQPGESFGELALLYNAPRAASIKAIVECTLFVLDRETFNNIVKEATIQRTEKFEQILSKIELLETMDPYERSKIADVAQTVHVKKGDYVIKEGEKGTVFYFLWDGTAIATKKLQGADKPEIVYHYKSGDYFGELALLKDTPRAANVIAETDLTLIAMDRDAFKRVLGPLEDILKRNFKKYEKFV